jgi:hypothetical protein
MSVRRKGKAEHHLEIVGEAQGAGERRALDRVEAVDMLMTSGSVGQDRIAQGVELDVFEQERGGHLTRLERGRR